MKIVDEGRISYALCRQLLEHIQHWPAWIERDDFEKFVVFDAHDIVARKGIAEGKRNSGINVTFTFRERRFGINFIDEGYSVVPDDNLRYGEIELYVDDNLVLSMDVSQEMGEFSHWRSGLVKALYPGNWMQELLDISAQIEIRNRERLNGVYNQKIREAGAKIDIPNDIEMNER